jgi:hypothetical protein
LKICPAFAKKIMTTEHNTQYNNRVQNNVEDFVLLNEYFAMRHGLSWRDSFKYLKQDGGIAIF